MIGHVPLVRARQRYGIALLALGLAALLLVVAVLLAQLPASLRKGGVVLSVILMVICLGSGVIGVVWTRFITWPQHREQLERARSMRRLKDLPAPQYAGRRQMAQVVVGGVLLGGLLWLPLNTVGFVAAPLLWLILSGINLETARLVRHMEQRRGVVYYQIAPTPFVRSRQAVSMLPAKGEDRIRRGLSG